MEHTQGRIKVPLVPSNTSNFRMFGPEFLSKQTVGFSLPKVFDLDNAWWMKLFLTGENQFYNYFTIPGDIFVDLNLTPFMFHCEHWHWEYMQDGASELGTIVYFRDGEEPIMHMNLGVEEDIRFKVKQAMRQNLGDRPKLSSKVEENEKRALATLREMVTEEEYRRYLTRGFISREENGKRFIIKNRGHLIVYKDNRALTEICIRTEGEMSLPPTDNVITLLTMLQSGEDLHKLGREHGLNIDNYDANGKKTIKKHVLISTLDVKKVIFRDFRQMSDKMTASRKTGQKLTIFARYGAREVNLDSPVLRDESSWLRRGLPLQRPQ